MNHFFKALIAIFIGVSSITAQELEKTWQFTTIENTQTGESLSISDSDVLKFRNGDFDYKLLSKDSLKASGHYTFQNNLLVFYYNKPKDTIRKYKVREFTDSTLVFTEKLTTYSFKSLKSKSTAIASAITGENTENTIKPSQGFSFNSLWRGILGMFTLIVIAFLFSSNRKL